MFLSFLFSVFFLGIREFLTDEYEEDERKPERVGKARCGILVLSYRDPVNFGWVSVM
jgi:hypothetical protein